MLTVKWRVVSPNQTIRGQAHRHDGLTNGQGTINDWVLIGTEKVRGKHYNDESLVIAPQQHTKR